MADTMIFRMGWMADLDRAYGVCSQSVPISTRFPRIRLRLRPRQGSHGRDALAGTRNVPHEDTVLPVECRVPMSRNTVGRLEDLLAGGRPCVQFELRDPHLLEVNYLPSF